MPHSPHTSRASRKCPSCNKSLYYSSKRCSDCGWQSWRSKPEFLWLIVALFIGGFFVIGLYHQNSDTTPRTQQSGDLIVR